MRFFTVTIGIFLLCSPATAQQVDPAAVVLQSRTAYSECVYNSVASQLLQIPAGPARQNADISSLAEQGFLACATEEQVLIGLLASNNVPRQITQTTVKLKRNCRDRPTALIEDIWREKIRGCSYREAIRREIAVLCAN